MKHLELHILQSVPVSCLNRDDLNSPKTAIFGGHQRARVSSQCWKRSIREMAKELSDKFKGERTRLIIEPLKSRLVELGLKEKAALDAAVEMADALAKFDKEKAEKEDKYQVKTLYFTSPMELDILANTYAKEKDSKKAIKAAGSGVLKDAADIALFGRMVANDPSLGIEAASMFSHAVSTHKADNEIDFFTAVDDNKDESTDDAGAGMMGTLEFNSATFYRFAALNLDMLADKDHLAMMTKDERKDVVKTFIEATLKAVPTARKNSMNGNTLPGYVLGIVREKGHPIQFVNAFEKPIKPFGDKGLFDLSLEALENEHKTISDKWNLEDRLCVAIPKITLKEFLEKVIAYVE
jgi:CRISPR system Cascade subunit CasC